MAEDSDHLRKLVAEVSAAYLSNSHASPSDIPAIVAQISASLSAVGSASPTVSEPEAPAELTRAQIAKSITPDALISFEDGKLYKTLRRHLATRGLTPQQYVAKWGLPTDYPMTAPGYSAMRSAMAKRIALGSGRTGGGKQAAAADAFEEDAYAPKQAAKATEPEPTVSAPEAENANSAPAPAQARRPKTPGASKAKPKARAKKTPGSSKAKPAAPEVEG